MHCGSSQSSGLCRTLKAAGTGGYGPQRMRQEAASSTKPMQGENSTGDVRPLASLICFLLPKGDASAWHRADADEVWLWHGPASIVLELGGIGDKPDEGHAERHVPGISEGSCTAQLVIPAGTWQRTLASEGEALLSCAVSPGFVYAGFSLRGSLLRHRCRSCRARSWQPDAPLSPCVPLHR